VKHDPVETTTRKTGQAAEYPSLSYDEREQRTAQALARIYQPGRAVPSGTSSYLAWKIIEAKPSRMHAWHRLKDELSQVTPWTIDTVISSILDATACWVVDLPASEKYHHRAPFGLFDHGLEVCLGALLTHKRDFEWWRKRSDHSSFSFTTRLVTYLGVLHDIGKVFDVEVKAPRTGEVWDPLREPLAFFKLRHDMGLLDPTPHTYRPHRGVHGHEEKGRCLVPAIIHRSLKSPITPHVVSLYNFYTSRYDRPEPTVDTPEDRILQCVLEADRDSACASSKGDFGGPDFLDALSKRRVRPPRGTFKG
jgi:hypothetical protein